MNEHRIARADIFFAGGLVASLIGRAVRVGFAEPPEIVALGAVLFLSPLVGTFIALLVASQRVRFGPFLWAIVGAAGASFIGLASALIVYDLVLIGFAATASVIFVVMLAIAIFSDGRWWTRVLRLVLVPATSAILTLPWLRAEYTGMQAVGAWLLATWPLAGAALLAPVLWRLEPALPDGSELTAF